MGVSTRGTPARRAFASSVVCVCLTALLPATACAKGEGLTEVGAYRGAFRGNYYYDLELVGDNVYLTDNHGAVIVDVGDPGSPMEVARVDTGGACFSVAASGSLMYVGAGKGLTVVDVSGPGTPEIIGDYGFAEEAYDIRLVGESLFIADNAGSLAAVDVSDAASPVVTSRLDTQGPCRSLAVAGDTLYAVDVLHGVMILDISDAGSPQLLETMADTVGARGVLVKGDLLAVNIEGERANLYDVSDPVSPALLGTIIAEYGNNRFVAAQTTASRATGSGPAADNEPTAATHLLGIRNGGDGVSVWDVADPLSPCVIGYYPIRGGCHGIASRENYVYAAMDKLYILTPAE